MRRLKYSKDYVTAGGGGLWVGYFPHGSPEDVRKTTASRTSAGDVTLVLFSHWPGSLHTD